MSSLADRRRALPPQPAIPAEFLCVLAWSMGGLLLSTAAVLHGHPAVLMLLGWVS
jgi:hypothetical protein